MTSRKLWIAAVAVIVLGLAALVIRGVLRPGGGRLVAHDRPVGIMGTQTSLTVVAGPGQRAVARRALLEAQTALRRVEARMSAYLEASELARLNAAAAGKAMELSPEALEVLRLSKRLHSETDGAFDATCLPLFRLWSQAGRNKRLPTAGELTAARAACGWDKWELLERGARKSVDGAGVGLGGIAKGFGIDRAAEAMRREGALGGLVEVGGDIRCFGPSPGGGKWRIAVRNPFGKADSGFFGTLELADAAVCTSGNYERFTEIAGRHYSHIIDPRTGMPVDFAPSVTVVASMTAIADGWATALSVLGPDGFRLIPSGSGIEAMIVTGGPADYRIHQTAGFGKLLAEPVASAASTSPMPAPP